MKKISSNKLYEVDEASNALIPVLKSASDTPGNRVIEKNMLYELDPETNARIPVVDVQGGSGSGGGSGGDQVQSDWTETDTTAVSYIKNKPFYELPEGSPLPETAQAGANLVYVDSAGKVVSAYQYDGFIWIQTGADYNLIFNFRSQYGTANINGATFSKQVGAIAYYVLPAGYSPSQIATNDLIRISKEYSLNYIHIFKPEADVIVKLENISSVYFTVTDPTGSNSTKAASIEVSNVDANSVSLDRYAVDVKLTDIDTFRGNSPVQPPYPTQIGAHAVNMTLERILTPGQTYLNTLDMGGETTCNVRVTDFFGDNTEREGFDPTSFNIQPNPSASTPQTQHCHLYFRGNTRSLTISNYGANYANSDIGTDIGITIPSMIDAIQLTNCNFLTPDDLNLLFDTIISDGTVREPSDNAQINIREVTGFSLSAERITALEALNFLVSIS